MSIDLADYEVKVHDAVRFFWASRSAAKQKQIESGNIDQGERAGVTGGKNMDGFSSLITAIVKANGLQAAQIHESKAALTLPGFFRSTKQWDLLVTHKGELVAAIELKSQVGPSFGNNFNNRTEEAIGTAHDFWTAYREGAFGEQPKPFVGWIMLVEDARASRAKVRCSSPHFATFKEFESTSYLKRYDLLCQKLIMEQLYTSAALITAPKTTIDDGEFDGISSMTSIKAFVTSFAGHIAATSARLAQD